MKNKFLTVILFTIFSVSLSAQTKNDYKPTLDIIFKSFKEKNYDLLKPLLTPNMKIGDFPTGQNDNIVPQLLNQLPTPNSYTVTETVAEGDNVRVSTIYNTVADPEMKRTFVINKEGKITEFDVLEGVMAEKKTAEKP